MHSPKQKEFFDDNACVWDMISVHDPKKVEYIADTIGINDSDDVLDVGTGTGIMIPYYLKRISTGSITALDYSENMIAIARSKNPERDSPMLRYRVGDLYYLKDKERFDLAICYSCYPHFVDKPLAISILRDSLRSGGRLVIAHSSPREKINQVHTEGGEVISMDLLPPMPELVSLFEDAGLDVVYTQDDSEYYMIIGKKK